MGTQFAPPLPVMDFHSPYGSPPAMFQRRTNALAFEKADCYTCVELQRACDRRRRKCNTCHFSNDHCKGYPAHLSWQPGIVSGNTFADTIGDKENPSASIPIDLQSQAHDTGFSKSPPRQFKFKVSKPRKKRRPNPPAESPTSRRASNEIAGTNQRRPTNKQKSQPTTKSSRRLDGLESNYLQNFFPEAEDNAAVVTVDGGFWPTATHCPNFDFSPINLYDQVVIQNELQDTDAVSIEGLNQCRNEFESLPNAFVNHFSPDGYSSSVSSSDLSNARCGHVVRTYSDSADSAIVCINSRSSIPSSPESPTLSEKFTNLLTMYDQDFCIIPITRDIEVNPFRCRQETSSGSRFLLHAILALSMQHVSGLTIDHALAEESQRHKNTALQLFRGAVEGCKQRSSPAYLDTAVILCSFDATQSAFGNWNWHFNNALQVLQACGGPKRLKESSRLRAQVAMFLWWDCTVALVSRSASTFPMTYHDVMFEADDQAGWDHFNLFGVPKDLFRILIELTELAAEHKKVQSMKWATFNLQRIVELESEVRRWTQEKPAVVAELEDEEGIQNRLDCFHDAEAWRHAMLLYIVRVFKWDRTQQSPSSISFHARMTLDHVRCCRRSSPVQKQLLLPVFLAGCETSNRRDRDFALEYCDWWTQNCRYRMFASVYELLQSYWAVQSNTGIDITDIWWGSFIDERLTASQQAGQGSCSILLG